MSKLKTPFFVLLYCLCASELPVAIAQSEQNFQQKSPFQEAIESLREYPVETLRHNAVPICTGYTCKNIDSVAFPEQLWNEATFLLQSKPDSPAMERALLAETLSHVEILLGRLTHTQYDVAGTFQVYSKPQAYSMQLDCIDEAYNMYMIMHLLKNEKKLRWHDIGPIVHRGWLLDLSYPHTALSIFEKSSGKRFVIDSWFLDNGRPPEVVTLEKWKSGWTPAQFGN